MKRFYLFFIILSAIFIVISGCDKNDDDTYITNEGDTHNEIHKTVPRNIQASSGNGIPADESFSHLISYNNKYVAFVTSQGNDVDAYQLYTVTAQPIKDKPTNYLIGGQGQTGGEIRLFRISPNSKWIVWIDNDGVPPDNTPTSWTLWSQKVNTDTGAPDGEKIMLQTYDQTYPDYVRPTDFRISPDSKWVAYRHATDINNYYQNELFCIRIDGSAPTVKVHPDITTALSRDVEEDYNFSPNSNWLVFRSDGNNATAGGNDEYGLYSYHVHDEAQPGSWANIQLVPSVAGYEGVISVSAPSNPKSPFRISSDSRWVVFTADYNDATNHNVYLFSVHIDPADVDADDPVQLHPSIAVDNRGVISDFEIASHNRVIFRANPDYDTSFGLYSTNIDDEDATADTWADLTIMAASDAIQGVNQPAPGGGGTPIAQVVFRLTPDKKDVVFIANVNSADNVIFNLFSHNVSPADADDPVVQIAPTMPDTDNNVQSLGVRDFQISPDHDYVVFISSLNVTYPDGTDPDTIYELYRAQVNREWDHDVASVDAYRRAFILHHELLIPDAFVYVFHIVKGYAYFLGTLADPGQNVYNGYYVDIDKVGVEDAVEHQMSDLDDTSVQSDCDIEPRTLEKYLFANGALPGGVYDRFVYDCYPPSGDGGNIFITYTANQETGQSELYLFLAFGPNGKDAPLMNDWTIKILALLAFMGIAILVSRKVCRA